MTKEETSKLLALFNIAGVKFEGDKKAILALWSKCLEDINPKFAFQAAERIIKRETELFANGLIAKVRNESKFLEEMQTIEQNKIGAKDDIRRIGRGNK